MCFFFVVAYVLLVASLLTGTFVLAGPECMENEYTDSPSRETTLFSGANADREIFSFPV